jgi:Domain of Unknown Function with PDB structure (DUF3857)
MKKLPLSLIGIYAFNMAIAQNDFAIAKIPDNIKSGADAVVRFDNTEFIIESYDKTITKHHWAVTIFTEKGENDHAMFKAYYNKFTKIKKIEGEIYDKGGSQLKKLKNSDIEDLGTSENYEISEDRIKIARFGKKYYPLPYTVVFSYEEESSNTFFYPSWHVISDEKVGLQSSIFTVKSFNPNAYRKKEFNLPSGSTISKEGKYAIERWEAKDLNPIKAEEYSKYEFLPSLHLAPIEYKMAEFSGSAKTWDDIASFYRTINEGRDVLPLETIAKLRKHVGQEKDPAKVTKLVYEFMQSHTRYFLVALGIGGWQCLKAEKVAQAGYGDCKALTNYTVALLKEMGIKAYPALIYGGDSGGDVEKFRDFPISKFNHVLACVPMQKDTIWLECTSQTNPAGYQGSFTGNRLALLVLDNGSKLVSTTQYTPEKNLQRREANVKIDDIGNATVKLNSTYAGIQNETRSSLFESLSTTEQKDWLLKSLNIPNFDILNFKLSQEKSKMPKVTEEINLIANRYASFSGERMFIKPNLMTRFASNPIDEEERKTGLYLNPNEYSFLDEDKIEFEIPAGYASEYLPKDVKSVFTFGEFNSKVVVNANKMTFTRSLKVKGGLYSKEEFANWKTFLKTINKSDNQKVAFIKEAK